MSRTASSSPEPGHLDDALLVAYLDREIDSVERDRVERHVGDCARCDAALDELHALSRRISRWLPLADEPPAIPAPGGTLRPARWTGALLRAAAVLALLAVSSLAIGPVRERVTGWIGFAGHPERPAPREPVAGPTEDEGGLGVSFLTESPRFTVSFEASAEGGTVSIVPVDGPRAAARVIGGDAELQVLPDGLVIRHASGPAVAYRLELPRGLERIEVRADGRTIWSGPPTAVRIDLARDVNE